MKRNHSPGYFKASMQNGGTLELDVYTVIGETWDGLGITVGDVKDQMDCAKGFSDILVRVNSPGGSAFDGIAIYNLIRAQKVPVKVCVDGVAASAASIIAMAGDDIEMGENTMIMIHNALGLGIGNATELRKLADTLDKVSDSIATTYVNRTGKTLDEVHALMNEETWMSAKDAITNGFATHITEDQDERSITALAMAKQFNYKHLKSAPFNESIEPSCSCQCSKCMEGLCSECENPDCVDKDCKDCPMQAADIGDSNLSQYEARLSLITHNMSSA